MTGHFVNMHKLGGRSWCVGMPLVMRMPNRALAGPQARGASATPLEPALDLSLCHIKPPLIFVGRSLEHSVLHQLRIFERLRRSPAAAHVVLPAAVLMRQPIEGAARVAWAALRLPGKKARRRLPAPCRLRGGRPRAWPSAARGRPPGAARCAALLAPRGRCRVGGGRVLQTPSSRGPGARGGPGPRPGRPPPAQLRRPRALPPEKAAALGLPCRVSLPPR